MPAPPLHLTFAEMMGDQDGVPRSVRDVVHAHPIYTHLGGIFHDLPYYVGAIRMMLGYWRENAAEVCPWGIRLHMDRPGPFAAHMVETMRHAEGPLTRDQRKSFLAGFLSHAALDHTLHPLVNYAADRQHALRGGEVSHHHRLVEKYQSLFIHLEMKGEDVIGKPEFFSHLAKVTEKNPFISRRVDTGLAEFMTSIFKGFFGEAPSVREWTGWVRSFRHIAFLISGVMASRNSRIKRTEVHKERYFSNEEFDFRDFFEAGRTRAASVLTLANDYFDLPKHDESSRERFVRDVALDSLAYPDVAKHPEPRIVALVGGQKQEMEPETEHETDGRLCAAWPG